MDLVAHHAELVNAVERVDLLHAHPVVHTDGYPLVSRIEIGKATIGLLDLNHERRIEVRQAEQMIGLLLPQPYDG